MRFLVLMSGKSRKFRFSDILESIGRDNGWYIEVIQGYLSPQKRQIITKTYQGFDCLIFDGDNNNAFTYQLAGRFIASKRSVIQVMSERSVSFEDILFEDVKVILDRFDDSSLLHKKLEKSMLEVASEVSSIESSLIPPFNMQGLRVAEFNEIAKKYIDQNYGRSIIKSSASTVLGKIDGVYRLNADNVIVIKSAKREPPRHKQFNQFFSEISNFLRKQSVKISKIHIINRFSNPFEIYFALSQDLRQFDIEMVSETDIGNFVESRLDIYYQYTKIDSTSASNFLIERLINQVGQLQSEIDKYSLEIPILRESVQAEESWRVIAETAAHKLGNPIFAMEAQIENIELALEKDKRELALNTIKKFKVSFERTKTILKQFRDVVSAYVIKPSSVNFDKLREDIEKCAISRGIPIEITLNVTRRHIFDQSKILDCVEELVSNSSYCNPEGTSVSVEIYEDDNNCIIKYLDAGIGIEEDLKERIFAFGFTKREGGSGLGMNHVKQTIQSHSGSIIEQGVFGKGVEFVITLPTPQLTEIE